MTLWERLRRRLRKVFIDTADLVDNFVGNARGPRGGTRSDPMGFAGPRRFSDYTDPVGGAFDYGSDNYNDFPGGDLPPGLEDRPNLPPPFSFGTEGGISIQPIPRQEGRSDMGSMDQMTTELTGFPKRGPSPQLQRITGRIEELKEGGISQAERPKVQALREKRQEIKARQQPSPWRPRPQPRPSSRKGR